jgi:hypothetical protein
MRWIETLFLRFYAANLSRSRRSEPVSACRDAITQLSALTGTAIVIVFASASLIVSPNWLRHLYAKDWQFWVILLTPGVGFAFWANRAFSRFSATPQAADRYRSRGAVWVTNTLYLTVPLLLAVFLGLLLRFLDAP